MTCPNCKKETLKEIKLYKNQIEKCRQCQGLWFDYDELRKTKDEKDEYLKWLDLDLWDKSEKFRASPLNKLCPLCKETLFEVNYGNSDIKVDVCNSCKGIWLDKGEFEKIIRYLKKTVNSETLAEYFKHALGEAKEVFIGPEKVSSEIRDFFLVAKLLKYRLYSQYPAIKDLIIHLPFTR